MLRQVYSRGTGFCSFPFLLRMQPYTAPVLPLQALPLRFFSTISEQAKHDPTLLSRATIDDLKVSPQLKQILKTEFQFEELTLVQAKAIPTVLDKQNAKDVVVQSKTGSGKTLAFLIPILETVIQVRKDGNTKGIKGLILAPTRELAMQIHDVLLKFTKKINIRSTLMIGGTKVAEEEKRVYGWAKGVYPVPDILIATPGRVLMHLNALPEMTDVFSKLQFLVLDEADRLIDIGFMDDIQQIAQHLPESRKTMFFSATMKKKADQLVQYVLKEDRIFINNDEHAAIPTLKQRYLQIDGNMKWATLLRLLMDNPTKKIIMFFDMKRSVDMFSSLLQHFGVDHVALHGGKDQQRRTNLFFQFLKDPASKILVCTDVAARGLDFPNVDIVIQADLPYGSEDFSDYFHRSGRTARAGREGMALLPLTAREQEYVLPVMSNHLKAQYKNNAAMQPLNPSEDDLVIATIDQIKNTQGELENVINNDFDLKFEARALLKNYETMLLKFQSLFLRGVRVYDAERVLSNMKSEISKSLATTLDLRAPSKFQSNFDELDEDMEDSSPKRRKSTTFSRPQSSYRDRNNSSSSFRPREYGDSSSFKSTFNRDRTSSDRAYKVGKTVEDDFDEMRVSKKKLSTKNTRALFDN